MSSSSSSHHHRFSDAEMETAAAELVPPLEGKEKMCLLIFASLLHFSLSFFSFPKKKKKSRLAP